MREIDGPRVIVRPSAGTPSAMVKGDRRAFPIALVLCSACGDSSDFAGFDGLGTSGGVSTTGFAETGAMTTAATTAPSDETGAPPPEDEMEADFRVPRASGRFVYSASELTDSVAVIDSSNLAIDVVAVGRGPTVVAPIAGAGIEEGRVAVLDQGSNDVAIVATSSAFTTSVEVREATAGANNLAVTPDGAFVFVYHDVDGPEALGAGSDQEVTVLDVAGGSAYEMTVGAHPREVVFASDSTMAYVVTDDGVNPIPLAELGALDKPDVVPVVIDPAIDPSTVEIQVAADREVALSRIEGEREIVATDLGSRAQFAFELPDIPTDLDLAPDGSFAILTTPSTAGSRFYELELPVDAGTQAVPYELPEEYVGLAQISPDGGAMVLFTTVDPFAGDPGGMPGTTGGVGSDGGSDSGSTDGGSSSGAGESSTGETDEGVPSDRDPRQRVTLVRRQGEGWTSAITLFVDDPILAVGVAPDGENAILLHDASTDGEVPPWGYTLLDLSKPFPVKKHQRIEVPAGPILFTPEGNRAIVLLRDDATSVRRLDVIDLRSFIVEALQLGSPPEGAGYVDATGKIFVSQEHPTGRITFVASDGAVETVTGYRLNDAVKD